MEIMRWCLQAQKNRFQLRICTIRGFCALSYALHLRCEKFLLGLQGNIVYLKKMFLGNVVSKNRLIFWGPLKGRKMKKNDILVHSEDNALVIISTKNKVSTTYFECTIRKVAYRGLCVKLRPSPPMRKISFRFARVHGFPLYLKKINCF